VCWALGKKQPSGDEGEREREGVGETTEGSDGRGERKDTKSNQTIKCDRLTTGETNMNDHKERENRKRMASVLNNSKKETNATR
jgi:hypothetical protein